jgi:hypothetical protein
VSREAKLSPGVLIFSRSKPPRSLRMGALRWTHTERITDFIEVIDVWDVLRTARVGRVIGPVMLL